MADLAHLGGRYLSDMNFVMMDKDGRHAGFTNIEGKTYVYMTGEMAAPAEALRTVIPLERRWGTLP